MKASKTGLKPVFNNRKPVCKNSGIKRRYIKHKLTTWRDD